MHWEVRRSSILGQNLNPIRSSILEREGASGLESKVFISIISASSYPGGKILFSTKNESFTLRKQSGSKTEKTE